MIKITIEIDGQQAQINGKDVLNIDTENYNKEKINS